MTRTTIAERNRNSVRAKAAEVDFSSMSPRAYEEWINSLSIGEFSALLDMHSEFLAAEKTAPAEPEYVPPFTADDPVPSDWIEHFGDEKPIADDLVCWVTYRDGDIGGPNRADHFIWEGEDSITAFAVAQNPKRRQATSNEGRGA
ncbi:hypothetical protein [Nitratireductor sp. GCM10026969]|uniref:hypothetical protein n=1 Tax=Nitratireductor sp. GCM10026969 TaxID=3252645 RepID=UPI00361AAF71